MAWAGRRRWRVGLLGLTAWYAATGPLSGAALELALEANAVMVRGLTPKGPAFLLGVTRTIEDDDFPVVRIYELSASDDDGDGTVQVDIEKGVPKLALFVVVDGTSGAVQAVTSAAFGLRLVPWRAAGPRLRGDGISALEEARTWVEILLVRPRVGAWALRAADGNTDDDDGQVDGKVDIRVDDLLPLGDSPLPPLEFLPSDLVVLIDPSAFEFSVSRLGGGANP